jgi:urease accessory protein
VYRNPHLLPCGHRLTANLGEGSLLALIPDPVQAFTGSRYCQHQQFSMAPDSGLILVDWLGSGRVARGERWAFDRFQSRNEVRMGDARVLLDSLLLDPADGPLADRYRLGRINCLALVVLIGSLLGPARERVLEETANLPVARNAPLLCSASPIVGGVLVRLAGESVEAVGGAIRRLLVFLPGLLDDDPWSRKW